MIIILNFNKNMTEFVTVADNMPSCETFKYNTNTNTGLPTRALNLTRSYKDEFSI